MTKYLCTYCKEEVGDYLYVSVSLEHKWFDGGRYHFRCFVQRKEEVLDRLTGE
jgi:hypothetical protein